MVLLAENARIPIDNPTTHLELTMVHEALILEYSARHLALIEWAVAIKLFAYMTIGIALFLPWGIADAGDWSALPYAFAALAGKLALAGGRPRADRGAAREAAPLPRRRSSCPPRSCSPCSAC